MLGSELGEPGSRVQDLNCATTLCLRLGQGDVRARLEQPKGNIQTSGTVRGEGSGLLGMAKIGDGSKGRQVSAHWKEELSNSRAVWQWMGCPGQDEAPCHRQSARKEAGVLGRVEGIPELERGLSLEVKADNTLFLSQTLPLRRPQWLVQKAQMVISASGQMWGPSEDVFVGEMTTDTGD